MSPLIGDLWRRNNEK